MRVQEAFVFMLVLALCPHHVASRSVEERLSRGLQRVKQVLTEERSPVLLAAETQHRYADKFTVVESMATATLSAMSDTFAALGMGAAVAEGRTGSRVLLLTKVTTCTADGFEHVDGDSVIRTEKGLLTTSTTEVKTRRKQYLWKKTEQFTLTLHHGSPETTPGTVLAEGEQVKVLRTRADERPLLKRNEEKTDVDITWLATQHAARFAVDRTRDSCRTPTRNREVRTLSANIELFMIWLHDTAKKSGGQCGGDVFLPVLPLMTEASNTTTCSPLGAEAFDALLREHSAEVAGARKSCAKDLEGNTAVADIRLLGTHLASLSQAFLEAMNSMEALLRAQLVSALGHEVGLREFTTHMAQHQREVLAPEYPLNGFSHAVRREGHAPDGMIAVTVDGTPFQTTSRRLDNVHIRFALNAASDAVITGPTHLHTGVHYTNGDAAGGVEPLVEFVATAREFASYILLIGKIAGDRFTPSAALIVKNKDTLRILLTMDTIPPPAVFREYVSSLSPEQQRFAKEYRKMQLAGSLFAVSAVQVKPLMEKVLNLPPNSLAKEFELTQRLMKLFIDYDVGAEMLAYDLEVDGEVNSTQAKVSIVKDNVNTVFTYINAERKELHEEAAAGRADAQAHVVPHAAPTPAWRTKGKKRSRSIERDLVDESVQEHMLFSASAEARPREREVMEESVQDDMMDTQERAETKPKVSKKEEKSVEELGNSRGVIGELPNRLDAAMDGYDFEKAMRPTTLALGERWEMTSRESLVAPFGTKGLDAEKRGVLTMRSLGLLDSLTKSGGLPIEDSEVHVVVPVTHHFASTLMNTAVVENRNPVELVEISMLLAASALFEQNITALVSDVHKERLQNVAPRIFV